VIDYSQTVSLAIMNTDIRNYCYFSNYLIHLVHLIPYSLLPPNSFPSVHYHTRKNPLHVHSDKKSQEEQKQHNDKYANDTGAMRMVQEMLSKG
jgi:hypothetical protein